jgi:alcohol dehydrogenase
MPRTISEHGVKEENLRDLAEMAAKQWTAQFNPRDVSVADFVELYRGAL